MIKEIVNFVEHLEKKSHEIFSEGLELKEGIYVFLEKEGEELVVKEENIFKVGKDTERNQLYEEFLALATNTEMLNAMKSFNSGPKIYIAIGSPFGIALNGKAYKKNGEKKLLDAADAYFKAARNYMNSENKQHELWYAEMKSFVKTKMLNFIASYVENEKVKDQFMFYFFMKEPSLKDYQEIQTKFLSEKLFNKDKFNVKTKNGELFGISDNLSGFNDNKEFLKHKTAPIELNYRVNGIEAQKLFNFFQLQQKNKVLPNPFPLFVDEQELTEEAVKFYKNSNKKYGHKEIVEELIKKKQGDLQNYYLIYFNNKEKGSRIIDLDFVSVFEHKFKQPIVINNLFNIKNRKLVFSQIETIFEFEKSLLPILFNNIMVSNFNDRLEGRYFFDFNKKNNPKAGFILKYIEDNKYHVSYSQTLQYRKAFFDYIYKSKRNAITSNMFNDILIKTIIDDIRHDELKVSEKTRKEYHSKEDTIKEKLNIWFSLYNYFANSIKKEDMVNKTQELFEKLKTIASSENNSEFIKSDDEFAFAAGQLIRTILNKSESGERSHALLEPFLQKTECSKLKLAIARAFDTYKHAFKFYKGDANRYEFDKIMSDVMGYETKTNMKDLLPMILAGYFSETIFKKEKEPEQ